jgi:hypothetical protein
MLTWQTQSPRSPFQSLCALSHRLGHARLDGFVHVGHRQQIKRLLNSAAVFSRKQHSIRTFAGNDDWLMKLSGLIRDPTKVGAGFAGGDGLHDGRLNMKDSIGTQ